MKNDLGLFSYINLCMVQDYVIYAYKKLITNCTIQNAVFSAEQSKVLNWKYMYHKNVKETCVKKEVIKLSRSFEIVVIFFSLYHKYKELLFNYNKI